MKFSYEDLISGDSIFVKGIGHFRSPTLQELKPTKGIGTWTYNFYINVLAWDKEGFLKFLRVAMGRRAAPLEKNQKLQTYDVVTLIETSRELLREAMAFFMQEEVLWNEKKRIYETYSKDENKS